MKSNFKKIVAWVLVFLWMCVIFGFSSQSGGESGGLSGKIVSFILNIFNISETEDIFNTIQFIVRKLAHGTEYLLLGILVFNAFYNTLTGIKKISVVSFVFCVVYSMTDEFHQLFIPERVGSIKDCLIDSTGALLGIIFCLIIILIVNKLKTKKIRF